MTSLLDLAGRAGAEALGLRSRLSHQALEERNAAARVRGLPEYADLSAWLGDLSRRTVCLTLLAGSGSRWVKSLEAARALTPGLRPAQFREDFDPALPRGLYPVRNFLPAGPRTERIPVAAYSLAAVRGLGSHVLVVRGSEEAIDAEVLGPLGIGPGRGPGERTFCTQAAPYGKPLGHGDAAWQSRDLWRGADYVVTNFGGDANSRLTLLSSLLVLDALWLQARGPDLLMPAALIPEPSYRIDLDAEGLPRGFFHAKLQAKAGQSGPGYTNVGLRLYRASALLEAVEGFRARHFVEGEGYAIPGNDPAGHEFALDNVDASLAAAGRARILGLCRPAELSPAKSLEDIPAFEEAIAEVCAEDGRAGVP